MVIMCKNILLQKIILLLYEKGFAFVTVSTLPETGPAVFDRDGYFVKPGDSLSLDTKFWFLGIGVRK